MYSILDGIPENEINELYIDYGGIIWVSEKSQSRDLKVRIESRARYNDAVF